MAQKEDHYFQTMLILCPILLIIPAFVKFKSIRYIYSTQVSIIRENDQLIQMSLFIRFTKTTFKKS